MALAKDSQNFSSISRTLLRSRASIASKFIHSVGSDSLTYAPRDCSLAHSHHGIKHRQAATTNITAVVPRTPELKTAGSFLGTAARATPQHAADITLVIQKMKKGFALEMPSNGHFLPWLTAPTLPRDSVVAASGGRRSSPSRRPLAGVQRTGRRLGSYSAFFPCVRICSSTYRRIADERLLCWRVSSICATNFDNVACWR